MKTNKRTVVLRCWAALWLAVWGMTLPIHRISGQNLQYAFTNFAGMPGVPGSVDGVGSAARFRMPYGVAVDSEGNVYVADAYNYTIRKVTPTGIVTTLAGSAGQDGSNDGTGSTARFGNPGCCGFGIFGGPGGLAVDGSGNIYVADTSNFAIRKVTPDGTVTTLAGSARQRGSADGTGSAARFGWPFGVAVDSAGNVYVADAYNHSIRKVTAAGVVTTLAGNPSITDEFGQPSGGYADGTGSAARFNSPFGVVLDRARNIYVADTGNSAVRKVTPGGVVTTLAAAAAPLSSPFGMAVDSAGNIYVTDNSDSTILKLAPSGLITTIAGTARVTGSADGVGPAAQFSYPGGVALDSTGNLYVGDPNNARITKGTPVPTFTALRLSENALTATLFGLPANATVVLQSSVNLRDWFSFQTNIVSGASLPISRSIDAATRAEFLRALVK